ncbi:hypothetical protein CDV31_014405 [Fusarium ambrosium]|uniref:chitinase n=1 Tax=Fusarium ambrosium TaxID=131363 RepID=A0A428SWP1_9HYPO|nr:hypothetical protein CDV31_014405 [Fusarium ambrosium]
MHLRVWLFCLLLLCLCVAAAEDDATCSATKRCKDGCCNKSGSCGFGPDYCGKNCISDCGRKSECNPGFEAKWAQREKCPLNVCCSKHGYCGTTKDYCGSKKVKRPSCDKDSGIPRVVGYFEGWARSRPCEVFWPEQIPIGLYTHINFAFGTIDPKTFVVKADNKHDLEMYKRLMTLKKKDRNLKVYLAVGGWTFNDPGPTATTFSDLAASVPRQKAFMNSLMSFMATHDFDGLDLDWEYPEAIDRSGKKEDFANFPKFMARLKEMMEGGKKGLTITLPASYWYLQHFDIKKLEKTVDFFNIMSYDLHGAWDKNATWTKPYLNAHTNLTEIELAMDLLWRNEIEPSKVVMGLGFYGRVFTAQTGTCMKPGCLFKDPGNAGECSQEKGVLLNSEIDAIVKKRNLKPQFFKEEAVKVITFGNQWLSYDDEETLKIKSEYAQSRCLGGVMVWAISQDTKDAKYNKALAKAVDRTVTSGTIGDNEEASTIVKMPNEQCRWSNCMEGCPKGWVSVPRSDGGARKNEKMVDETGCGGDGAHTFCCPATEKLPTCGWYGFKGGKCTKGNSCPSDMVEIASNQMYCDKSQAYQSACCKTDVKSMKVYGTCEWGLYPNCDDQEECRNPEGDLKKNYLIAQSASGSGGGKCDPKKNPHGLLIPTTQFRKYCCNANDPNLRFTDCQYFRDVGPAPDARPEGFCRSGCPPDRVRVAIDTEIETCAIAGIGGMARCCKTSFNDEFEVENSKLDAYRSAMKEWIDNPTCPNPASILSRRADLLEDMAANASLPMGLALRDLDPKLKNKITAQALLTYYLFRVGSEVMLEQMGAIWDSYVEENFPYLTTPYIKAFLGIAPEWETDGPEETARRIICSPHTYNARVAAIQGMNGGGKALWVNCTYALCDKDGYCGEDGEKGEVTERRRALLTGRSTHLSSHRHHQLHARQTKERRFMVTSPDGEEAEVEYTEPDHTAANQLPSTHPNLKKIAHFRNPDDCGDMELDPSADWLESSLWFEFQMEHPVDKQLIQRLLEDAAMGRLGSGRRSQYGPIPISLFEYMMQIAQEDGWEWPPIPSSELYASGNLFNRIMECLGSKQNEATLVVTIRDINYVKTYLMQNQLPIADDRWEGLAKDNVNKLLAALRATVSMFDYMNSGSDGPYVSMKLLNIVNNVVLQISYAENLWERHVGTNISPGFANFFVEWLKDWYTYVVTPKAQEFLRGAIAEIRKVWENETGREARQVMEAVVMLEGRIDTLAIDVDWEIEAFASDDE